MTIKSGEDRRELFRLGVLRSAVDWFSESNKTRKDERSDVACKEAVQNGQMCSVVLQWPA